MQPMHYRKLVYAFVRNGPAGAEGRIRGEWTNRALGRLLICRQQAPQWAPALERPPGHPSRRVSALPLSMDGNAMPLYCFRTLDPKGNLVEQSESELENDVFALIKG